MTTGNGLSGWVVMAIGPTTVSTTTDANGNYTLVVPGGTTGPIMYAVCEVVQPAWAQVSPTFPAPCATGIGYDFGVIAGDFFEQNAFGNSPL